LFIIVIYNLLILSSVKKYVNELKSNIVFSEWQRYSENDYYVTFIRYASNTNVDKNKLVKILYWTDSSGCKGICDDSIGYKTVLDPDSKQLIFSNKLYKCINNKCENIRKLSAWKITDICDNYVVFNRPCEPYDACRNIQTTLIKNWEGETPCAQSCFKNDYVYNKKIMTDPNNELDSSKYIFSNDKPCNTKICPPPIFSPWKNYRESTEGIYMYRTCENFPLCDSNTNDYIKLFTWVDTENCSTICGTGQTVKYIYDPNYDPIDINQKIQSQRFYPCKNNVQCESLVQFSDWNILSENNTQVTITRECTLKNEHKTNPKYTNGNICSIIDEIANPISLTSNWTGADICPKNCKLPTEIAPKTNKYLINPTNGSPALIRSKNQYNCNDILCPSADYFPWSILTQTQTDVTFESKCRNLYCDEPLKTQTIPWESELLCSQPCNGGTKKYRVKNPNNSSTYLESTIGFPCNTFTCDSIAKFSPWKISTENNDTITFNRTCSSDSYTCNNISPNLLTNTLTWIKTNCLEKCNQNSAYNKKYVLDPNDNITKIERDHLCNTVKCPNAQFTSWNILNESISGITFKRDCINPPYCTPPYLFENNVKFIPWEAPYGQCSKPCDGGKVKFQLRDLSLNSIISSNYYPCNDIPCVNNVVLSQWTFNESSSNSSSASFTRTCSSSDSLSCNFINSEILVLSIPWNLERTYKWVFNPNDITGINRISRSL